ncbi:hypothetical protein M138_0427 [Bacteroides fragilis str. S23L17]|nr:hypothetical protein M138_0427 [Bacteroides fragilis str. S23L17]
MAIAISDNNFVLCALYTLYPIKDTAITAMNTIITLTFVLILFLILFDYHFIYSAYHFHGKAIQLPSKSNFFHRLTFYF